MKCTKCGGDSIVKRYHSGLDRCLYEHNSKACGEHMHYRCMACGYDWTGPTADHTKGVLERLEAQ